MKKTYWILLILLSLACILPAQNSPLTLTAPNGGEVWTIGSTYAITWTQTNLTGNLSIMLLGANTPGSHNVLIAQSVPVTDGTYNWTIPASVIPGSNYRVRIASMAGGVFIQDYSDAPFTIDGGTPPPPPPPTSQITVTAPNGGETWAAGTTQDITWTYQNLEGEVRIELVRGANMPPVMVTPATPIASGSYAWTIPATIQPGFYKAHVVWLSVTAVYFGDLSDGFFEITGGTPPPTPQLTLTAPNGGESWAVGSTQNVTWTSQNVTGNVNLMLMGPGMPVIGENIPVTDGSYAWTIPATVVPGTHYRVRVFLGGNQGTYLCDVSDADFIITGDTNPPPPPPILALTAPNGGESWEVGTTQAITWTSSNMSGNVNLLLIGANSNGYHQPCTTLIAQNVPVLDGTFNWTIGPDVLPGTNYRVKIYQFVHYGQTIADFSDTTFSIVGDTTPPPVPNLVLTAPNGGESWQAGTNHPITWTFDGDAGFVMLQLMGGPQMSPIVPIAMHMPATAGTWDWHIPHFVLPQDTYRVKISLVNNAGVVVEDESDADFSITAAAADTMLITVTSPNGGESWAKGSIQNITWTASEFTGNVRIMLARVTDRHHQGRFVIAPSVPNTGTYAWTIPTNMPGGDNFKVIVKYIGGYGMDSSDAVFSITDAAQDVKASPNPTYQGTEISFEVKVPQLASVRVYNIKGQLVRTLADSQVLSGKQSIFWDGNDSQGRKVSAGMYFARITSAGFNAVQKIIVLK
jgi:hypothetical protein